MAKPLAVLIVEDSESDAQLIVRLLSKAGYKVNYKQVDTPEEMRSALEEQAWDIVISDYSLPQFDGSAALALLKETGLDIPFITVSGTMGEETAVSMMRAGAHDYLMKGSLTRLVPAIERELEQAVVRRERKQGMEEIQSRDKRFRALIENSADAITLIDASGKVVYDTPAAPGMLGYGPEDWIGKDIFQLVHPDDLKKSQSLFQNLLKTPGEHIGSTFRVRHKSGSWLWIEIIATNLLEEPSVNAIVLNYRDSTGRIEAEEAVRESESILRGFLEQSADAIMLTNEQGEIIQWSKGAEILTGYSRDESLGKPLWDIQFRSAPDEIKTSAAHELIKTNLQPALLSGQAPYLNRLIEATIQRPDGSRAITQTLAFSTHTDKGYLLGSILRDITESKQAEEALNRSRELLRQSFASLHDAIFIIDADPIKIVDCNPSASEMFGYDRSDMLGQTTDFLHVDGAALIEFRENLDRAVEDSGFLFLPEFRMKRKDGTIFFTDHTVTPLRNEQGRLTGWVSVVRDITERKQADEALQASESRYKGLFEDSPIALWEEDFSVVKGRLDVLRNEGITDFQEYFTSHPGAVAEHAALVKVVDVNKATLKLLGAGEKEDLFKGLPHLLKDEPNQEFQKELIQVASGKTSFRWEGSNRTLDGRLIDIDLSWFAAPGYENTLSKVIVSMIDITERKRAEEALQTSEARYKGLFEDSPIALWEEDFSAVKGRLDALRAEGITDFQEYFTAHPEVVIECAALIKVLDVNNATLRLFGADHKEDIFNDLEKIFAGEPVRVLQSELVSIAAGKTRFEWEGINNTLDGRLINIELNWSVAPGYENSLSRVILSMIDVTERKQAEEAVRKSEQVLREAETLGHTGSWEQDLMTGELFNTGENLRLFFGDDPGKGEPFDDFSQAVHPDDREFVMQRRAQLLEGGPGDIEYRVVWPDGSVHVIFGRATVVYNELGQAVRVYGTNVDVTERRQAEEKLAEERNLLRTLIDHLPDRIYTMDAEGRKTLSNLADWQSTGKKTMEDVIGKTDFDNYPRELAEEFWALSKATLESGEPILNYEERGLDAEGNDVSILTTHVPLRDGQGNVVGLVGIGRDITDRKRAEAERQALTEIMQAAALITGLNEFLGVIRESLSKVFSAENFFVVFHDPETGLFEEVFSVDKYDRPMPPSRLEKSITSYVYRTGEPLLLTEARFAELVALGELELVGKNMASWLGAPLKTPAGIIGVIAVQNYEDPNSYSERDRAFLASIGGQVALAIERKQAETALARSEREYRTLFENMPIGLYRTAADGRLLDVNDVMVKMFGYKDRGSLLAANVIELYVDPASDRKFKGEIEKTGIISNFEAEFRRPDGTTFWTEDHNRVIRAENGEPLYYEGSLIDITERKRAEERIQRQLQRLAALRSIDQVITSSFDMHNSLTVILKHITDDLGVDAADVLLLNNVNLSLEFNAGVGFRNRDTGKAIETLSHSLAGRAVLERSLIQVPDLRDHSEDVQLRPQLADEDFVSYFGLPLIAKGSVRGVLEIFHRTHLQPDQEWLDFLNTIAGQAALAIDNTNLFESLQRSNIDLTLAYDATIEGWSHAMDLRDKETEGHTLRVTEMTMELAGLFGIKDEDMIGIRRGALLHDIGKMGIPDGILLKPDKLTDAEWVLMRKHPSFAFEMLSPIRYLQSAIDIPYCHHEKWDGTGYPRGLKGEQIPLPARIFAIADVWDAVTSDRPYRSAWTKEKAIDYLRSESGKHFDPQVLKVCLEAGVFDRKNVK